MQTATSLLLASLLALAASACAPPGDEPRGEGDDVGESEDALSPAMRFDVATLNCANGDEATKCPASNPKCLCQAAIEHLNHDGGSHFLAVGSDRHKAAILDADNVQAVYENELNEGFASVDGATRADRAMAEAREKFPSGVPTWFVVNEISAGLWPDSSAYRTWVAAFARRMHVEHGRKVIIAAPFARPGHHAADWQAIAAHAWIAAEVYLTGADVNASGNSVPWCKERYQESKSAYLGLGIPASRLMLVEHFGNTAKGTKWGRAGVGDAGWRNAIRARSRAAREVGFAGFLSYSWASNQMEDTWQDRLGHIDAYAGQILP